MRISMDKVSPFDMLVKESSSTSRILQGFCGCTPPFATTSSPWASGLGDFSPKFDHFGRI